MSGTKLVELLHRTWESAVFGDSYPLSAAVGGPSILQRIDRMRALMESQLAPILAEWMRPTSPAQVSEIVRQIAPKSVAFCSAIAAGELEDTERLAQAGLTIALVYWADHRMDRGDLAMEAAILQRAGWRSLAAQAPIADAALVGTRMVGLAAIERNIRAFSRPDDAAILIDNVLHEVLCREVRVRELSRLFGQRGPDSFWEAYAHEVAEHSVLNVALVYVTAAIYAIYRRGDPSLPPLSQILADPAVMRFLNGPAAGMIRVLDDLGDREIDSGAEPEWGQFTLNIFNQPHPLWASALLQVSGVPGADAAESVVQALQAGDQASCAHVAQTFVDAVRAEFAGLPAAVYRANQLFLDIGKRVIEAGYVNAIGDVALADQ